MKDEPKPPGELKTRTRAFALRIIRLYSALPNVTVAQVLGKQLLRSGTSVGAHYREAVRSRSDAEFISKKADCRSRKKPPTGWNCSKGRKSFPRAASPICGKKSRN